MSSFTACSVIPHSHDFAVRYESLFLGKRRMRHQDSCSSNSRDTDSISGCSLRHYGMCPRNSPEIPRSRCWTAHSQKMGDGVLAMQFMFPSAMRADGRFWRSSDEGYREGLIT